MLKLRLITALILIPLVLWVIVLAPPFVFNLFTACIILLAAWEWSNLMGLVVYWQRASYLLGISIVGTLCQLEVLPFWILLGILGWCVAIYLLQRYHRGQSDFLQPTWVRGLIGFFVLIPFYLSLLMLYGSEQEALLLILFVLIVALMDTGAYFVGRRFGRRRLAPLVSPGKTIEGLIGGMVTVLVALLLLSYWLPFSGSILWGFILISLIAALFSAVGDLTESMLKRQRGIKDSGILLPGHGGILDRLDGYTAAAPVFALGMMLLGLI